MTTLLDNRPRVRPDLLFSRELSRGPERVYLVKVRGGKAFEVAAKEHFLMRRLDGQRSLAEIGEEYAARFGRRLGPAQWSQLLGLLHHRGLLHDRGPLDPGAATGTAASTSALRRAAAALGWLFTVPAGAAIGVGLLAMYGYLAAVSPGLWRAAAPAFVDWRSLVGLVAVTYVSAVLHELAHGLTAADAGCRAIRINLLALSCRVDDYLYLPSRARQIAIAAAGAVANSLFLVPFVVACQVSPAGSGAHRFAAAAVVVGAVQSLVNLVPVPPLDGYKILSHLLGAVDLAAESRRYVWSWLSRRGAGYPRRARLVLGLYGTAWLVGAGAVMAAVAFAAGLPLRPLLGDGAFAVSALVVSLTVAGWAAGRSRLTARTRSNRQPH